MMHRSFFMKVIEKDFDDVELFFSDASDADIMQLLSELHFADIAEIIEHLETNLAVRILELLDPPQAADVLAEIDIPKRQTIVESISDNKLIRILDEMNSDDAADVIEELPATEAKEILAAIDQKDSAEVQKLLKYDSQSAGGIMQTELIAIPLTLSLQNAIEYIRSHAEHVENIQNIYVVDDKRFLKGIIPINTLILQSANKQAHEVMETEIISIPVEMDQEEVAKIFQKYDSIALPVVDKQGVLLGRILIDDVVDVIAEEASEDIYRLAGVNVEEHLSDNPFRSARLRLPWLLAYISMATLSSFIIMFFQNTLQNAVILAAIMPVIAGLGGNAGTQSLTVITRALALGQLQFKDAKLILLKELTTSLLNGIVLGIVGGFVLWMISHNIWLGIVLLVAMVSNVLVAAFAGTATPLILKRLNIDPALASGIFVTTLTDVLGFLIFLSLATLFANQIHGI